MIDKAELERLAERVRLLPVREDTDGGTFCAQYEQRGIECKLRTLAARCDTPTSGATCIDQVPLPEPVGWCRVEDGQYRTKIGGMQPHDRGSGAHGPWASLYDVRGLREYAETVAAPLRDKLDSLQKQIHRRANAMNEVYAELQRVAPWSESNDMDWADEMICGINLFVQDKQTAERERDTYKAADEAMQEEVGRLHAEIADLKRERDEARRDADGWHDEKSPLLDVLMMEGDDPFVCAARGRIAGVTEEVENNLKENGHPAFEKMGDGVYTFRANYFEGQYGEYGMCEIPSGYELDFVKFQPLGDGAIDSAMGDSKTTVAEDVAKLRKISDSIGGKS